MLFVIRLVRRRITCSWQRLCKPLFFNSFVTFVPFVVKNLR